MAETYEELVSRELDALYQGALFLYAGDRRAAEELLVETLTVTFPERGAASGTDDPAAWLMTRLVRSYLGKADVGTPLPESSQRRAAWPQSGVFEGMGAVDLFEAARDVPPSARAALWLVLLRRWSYDEAAAALALDRDGLLELLLYRDALVGALMRRSGSRLRRWGV